MGTTIRGQKKRSRSAVPTTSVLDRNYILPLDGVLYHGPDMDMCLNYGFIVELAFHLTNL